MGRKDPRVDTYISRAPDFAKPILSRVRAIVHDACPDADETLKWGVPTFTHHGILCGIAAFKEHCRVGFWQGTHFERVTSLDDLPSARVLAASVRQAAARNAAGKQASRPKRSAKKPLPVPKDMAAMLARQAAARKGFDALSPGYRREYIEWIADAKTAPTRARRLATAAAWIAEGKPRNWKYMKK